MVATPLVLADESYKGDGHVHRVTPCDMAGTLLRLGTHVTTCGRATERYNHNYLMCWGFSDGLPLAALRGKGSGSRWLAAGIGLPV